MKTRRLKKIRRPPPIPIGYNELGIDEMRKVLYRNFHEICGMVYLVEISRNKTKVFIVLFESYSAPVTFIAETLHEKIAFTLFAKHDYHYPNFIETLYISYGKLQI